MLTNGEGKEHVINQKGYRQKQYQSALQPLGRVIQTKFRQRFDETAV